jgi:hypothetical protein
MKIIVIIFSLFLFSELNAQTKTEEAKEKLDNEKEITKEEENRENTNQLTDVKKTSFFDSLLSNIVISTVTLPLNVLSHFIFNTNLEVGDTKYKSLNTNYDSYPYQKFNGMRTSHFRTKKFISEIQFFSGSDFTDIIRSELFYRFHLYDNSIFFKYSYLYEKNAPLPIHEIQFSYQRKARLPVGIDGGIFLGYKNYMFGSNSYKGFNYGAQFEFYPVNPLSFQIAYDGTIYKNSILTNLNIQSRYHFEDNAIAFTFNKSNIIDVHFNTFSVGFIKYF